MRSRRAFEILHSSERAITDEALETLLWGAYVDEGFTAPDAGSVVFAADAVRARGEMFVAWHVGAAVLEPVGMVIVVPPTSSARRIAREDEVEMHLLAVDARQRGQGVGKQLVERALVEGRRAGCTQMVLWTQPTMSAAQRVYTSCGFKRAPARDQDVIAVTHRPFLVFEKAL